MTEADAALAELGALLAELTPDPGELVRLLAELEASALAGNAQPAETPALQGRREREGHGPDLHG